MKEIIKIQETDGKKAVSARELYENLGFNKAHWAKWYKKNILNNQFAIENEDWQGFTLSVNGNETKDFALSIDFAKKICMLARTDKGEEIRQYFIDVEKAAIKAIRPLSTLDILEASIKHMREQRIELDEVKQDVLELKAKTTTRPEYFTIAGYGSLNGVSVNIKLAARLGRMASSICRSRGLMMDETPDPRFGVVKMYPKNVLDEVFNVQVV